MIFFTLIRQNKLHSYVGEKEKHLIKQRKYESTIKETAILSISRSAYGRRRIWSSSAYSSNSLSYRSYQPLITTNVSETKRLKR
jgi:hypothetical protein